MPACMLLRVRARRYSRADPSVAAPPATSGTAGRAAAPRRFPDATRPGSWWHSARPRPRALGPWGSIEAAAPVPVGRGARARESAETEEVLSRMMSLAGCWPAAGGGRGSSSSPGFRPAAPSFVPAAPPPYREHVLVLSCVLALQLFPFLLALGGMHACHDGPRSLERMHACTHAALFTFVRITASQRQARSLFYIFPPLTLMCVCVFKK